MTDSDKVAVLTRRNSVKRYGHVKGGVSTKSVPQFDVVDEDELPPTMAKVIML